jgi:putative addiction module killer protein
MPETKPRQISVHIAKNGKCAFRDWINSLQDVKGKAAILGRVNRVRAGNFGDCARYGPIAELRVDFGPGYRVYLGQDGPVVVVLLVGGDKSTQPKDFVNAKEAWNDYQERKAEALASF